MTQVSRRFIKKDTEDKINNLFWESMAICGSKDLAAIFLNDLLTPTEQIMLSKRLAIAYLLLKGQSYGVISSILKVSSPTIGTVSLMLKIRGKGVRRILGKIAQQQQWKSFFQELGETAMEILGQGKGSNWKAMKSFEFQRKLAKQNPL